MNFIYSFQIYSGYNNSRYNDIPGITMNVLFPCKSYSKMYGTER